MGDGQGAAGYWGWGAAVGASAAIGIYLLFPCALAAPLIRAYGGFNAMPPHVQHLVAAVFALPIYLHEAFPGYAQWLDCQAELFGIL